LPECVVHPISLNKDVVCRHTWIEVIQWLGREEETLVGRPQSPDHIFSYLRESMIFLCCRQSDHAQH
jgi:hypothetical protein